MHVQDFCGFFQCLFNSSGTSFHVFHSLRPKAVRILQHTFASRPRFHLTPLTMKVFDEPLFCFFSTITLVNHVNSTLLSFTLVLGVLTRVHSRNFKSILVLCQEEAMREPCLQPLRLLPTQLLMPMSLSQLHAAIFSTPIATPDSTECVLEVVSFSELSAFLELSSP